MNQHGYVRVSCASTRKQLGDPWANVDETARVLSELAGSDIVLFEELGVTGYTCGELFNQDRLLSAAESATARLADRVGSQLVIVGTPVRAANSLYNCAAVLNDGEVLGLVPKQFLPGYGEFNECKWFRPADGSEPETVRFAGRDVPLGIDLLFECGPAVVSVAICEDDWMPIPPSSFQALAGALVQCNLSASPEAIGKHEFRLNNLIVGQSARHISASAYASAGPTESTTDLVFGGHCAIAENGVLLAESPRVGDGGDFEPERRARESHHITADVDLHRLRGERHAMNSYADCASRYGRGEFRRLPFVLEPVGSDHSAGTQAGRDLIRFVTGTPFVPQNQAALDARCAEIFGIQCAGLARRLEQLPAPDMHLGISGGLDSTLAALVGVKTLDLMGLPRTHLHGLTLPGFGTSSGTLENARRLMALLELDYGEEDICDLTLATLRQKDHHPFGVLDPAHNQATNAPFTAAEFRTALTELTAEQRRSGDLRFENIQARLRTFLLMSNGFVLGTGDLSELALGWCTYNGDHMSMYNVNSSVPKTLVRWIVRHVAQTRFDGELRDVLLAIADTDISPELLPPTKDGAIAQRTEDYLGPYVLHDFFLYHMVRHGASPAKIRFLATHADWPEAYDDETIDRALAMFYRRFFSQQYKRTCVPDGPKVGTVSLSPRGDWKMPSDASPDLWLREE